MHVIQLVVNDSCHHGTNLLVMLITTMTHFTRNNYFKLCKLVIASTKLSPSSTHKLHVMSLDVVGNASNDIFIQRSQFIYRFKQVYQVVELSFLGYINLQG